MFINLTIETFSQISLPTKFHCIFTSTVSFDIGLWSSAYFNDNIKMFSHPAELFSRENLLFELCVLRNTMETDGINSFLRDLTTVILMVIKCYLLWHF